MWTCGQPALACAMFHAMVLSGCLVLAFQAASAEQPKRGVMLSPGKPAGIALARSFSDHAAFVGVSIVIVAAATLLPTSATTTATTGTGN
jgi:hypothetical protein